MNVVQYKLKSNKKQAPSILSYFVAFSYIAMAILVILCLLNKNNSIFFFIGIGLVLIDFLLSHLLSWYTYAEIKFYDKEFIYDVHTNINVMGIDYTRYKVKYDEISNLKFQGNKVIVEGKIGRKEPKLNYKEDKKVTILDITDDVRSLLNEKVNHNNG